MLFRHIYHLHIAYIFDASWARIIRDIWMTVGAEGRDFQGRRRQYSKGVKYWELWKRHKEKSVKLLRDCKTAM